MKFVKNHNAVHDINEIKRMDAVMKVAKSLSHNGGMHNTMMQAKNENELQRKGKIGGYDQRFLEVILKCQPCLFYK